MNDDLISRKALIAEYDRVHIGPPGGARKLMEDAPTVDAVEVEHGQWEWDIEDIYRCTCCGAKNRVKEVYGQPDFNYCPQCGAKMDGGENNV